MAFPSMRTGSLRPVRGVAKVGAMLAALTSTACVGPPAGDASPGTLTLKLYRITADGHFSYFMVDPDGTLAFGGGKEARARMAEPVGTLTAEERRRLRATIERVGLMTLKSRRFGKAATVTYEVAVSMDGARRSLRAVDAAAAPLRPLHDQLMEMYTRRAHKLPQF